MGQQAEQKDLAGKKDRKSIRTRKKSKRGDSKVESNDSPEIPDRGETSDIPGLASGRALEQWVTRNLTRCLSKRISRPISVPGQHSAKQVSPWISTFSQTDRVTSGRITHSKF